MKQPNNTDTDNKLKKAVDRNLEKYSKTYKLLDEYDRSPKKAPKYETELESLRKALQSVSS